MSDQYKHISEKAARKASDELARVKAEQRAGGEGETAGEARAKVTGVLADPDVANVVHPDGGQSTFVH